MGLTRNQLCEQSYRGFESLLLRQSLIEGTRKGPFLVTARGSVDELRRAGFDPTPVNQTHPVV